MDKKTYKPTRRNWVKLWVDEWLGGTTRFELSEKQRSIWIDLLAMAGKSRYPGIVASGKYEDGYRGYPVSYLAGTLVYDPNDFIEALTQCERYGKIKMERKIHDGNENVVIYINSWDKYQSEYLRQKKYDDTESVDIFNFWNENKIIEHKKISPLINKAINKALKNYTVNEIKIAISVYAEIISHPDMYWFDYKWTLQEFMSRDNGIVKFLDLETAKKNYKKDSNPNGNKKEPIPLLRNRITAAELEEQKKKEDIEWKKRMGKGDKNEQ